MEIKSSKTTTSVVKPAANIKKIETAKEVVKNIEQEIVRMTRNSRKRQFNSDKQV